MRVEIQLDPACGETKVVIVAREMSGEVQALAQRLAGDASQLLAGFQGGTLQVLEEDELIRIYAAQGKVVAATSQGEYTLRLRLYELEERLDKSRFVRISNSEIINLKQVKNFDLSLTGTICVRLAGGAITYVSRRYMAKIKQVLGI